jgi:hypothetical protein
MREIDELYADSGEPVKESRGVSRGTALKVGGIGLAGALAALMPGRAGAGVKKHASNASCAGTGFLCAGSNQPKLCGYDNGVFGDCFCSTLFYGKIRPTRAPVGACIENSFCYAGIPCSGQFGINGCPAGTACITDTCCETIFGYGPLCLPYCQQGSQGQAKPLNTPKTAAHK